MTEREQGRVIVIVGVGGRQSGISAGRLDRMLPVGKWEDVRTARIWRQIGLDRRTETQDARSRGPKKETAILPVTLRLFDWQRTVTERNETRNACERPEMRHAADLQRFPCAESLAADDVPNDGFVSCETRIRQSHGGANPGR